MTMNGDRVSTARRVTWRSCLVACTGLAVVGVAAPSAGAGPVPPFQYSSMVTAIGVQTALFSRPEPSSVPDLSDVQSPSSDAQLDSFGTSQANGHIGNLNGLGVLPSLICLASSQFCKSIPIATLTGGTIKNFPPPDPLDAQSTYPAQQHATAPAIGKKQATVTTNSGPFKLAGATAASSATATATTTNARDGAMSILGGITIGSAHTSTTQTASQGRLTTVATAAVSDINIGTAHLLHIGSVLSTLRIVSRPNKQATDTASSVISGSMVLGKPATIDRNGVHVNSGPKLPKPVADAYQKLLDTVLKRAGFGLQQASILRSDSRAGHSVSIAGLELFSKRTVKGAPPVNAGFPPGVPCPIKTPGQLPVDPCAGVALNLNANYRGQIALGQVGAVSLARPPAPTPKVPKVPTSTSPVTNTPRSGNVGTGSTGRGFTGRTGDNLPGGSAVTSSGKGPSVAPTLAGRSQSFLDPLSGVAGRLWWFFPLIALSLLAIAGRLRLPARLPRAQ
jgi:hypothetical protein